MGTGSAPITRQHKAEACGGVLGWKNSQKLVGTCGKTGRDLEPQGQGGRSDRDLANTGASTGFREPVAGEATWRAGQRRAEKVAKQEDQGRFRRI